MPGDHCDRRKPGFTRRRVRPPQAPLRKIVLLRSGYFLINDGLQPFHLARQQGPTPRNAHVRGRALDGNIRAGDSG